MKEEMNDKVFYATKQMAKVFAQEYVEHRITLHALVAMDHLEDPEYWPIDFPYEIDADIASMNGIANINWNWEKEVATATDVFYIKYFNAELYHNGAPFGSDEFETFTDPMDDLGMTLDQVNIIKDIIRDGFYYTIEEHPCNNEDIVDQFVGWLQDKEISENELMNDVNDILE